MPMDDLFQALNMFKQGVNELQTARVIQGANQQVQSIRASEASEADKRNQLTAISHQLVGQLGALGAPVSDIAQQAANVAPTQFADANHMYEQGVLTGNKELQDMAKKQQKFQFDLEEKKALLAAKLDPMLQMKKMMLEQQNYKDISSQLEKVDKRVDTQTSRFGNIAKLQGVNNQIQDARTLINSGQVTRQSLRELAVKWDSMLSQGASTISGADHLEPNIRAQMRAKVQEFLTNKPVNIAKDVQEFTDFYSHAFDRLEEVNKGIITDAQKKIIQPVLQPMAKHSEGGAQAVEDYVKNKLGLEGVSVDRKTGKINFGQAAGQPPQMKAVMVRDKNTGQMIKALQGPDGRLYSAEGM